MNKEKAIAHFEALRQDMRDEIKSRIRQRDKYSIQLTISLGALVAVSFSSTELRLVLLAVPLVSIYFTILILYSYKIHSVIAKYLREEIEPELAHLCETPPEKEWEIYYKDQNVPGIRRDFFISAMWFVCILSLLYLWFADGEQVGYTVLSVVTASYGLAVFVITLLFYKR